MTTLVEGIGDYAASLRYEDVPADVIDYAKRLLEVRDDLTALYREGARPAGIAIRTGRGTFKRDVLYPKGDPRNPMTWIDVTHKFMSQAVPRIGEERARSVVERAMRLEDERDMAAFLRALVACRP